MAAENAINAIQTLDFFSHVKVQFYNFLKRVTRTLLNKYCNVGNNIIRGAKVITRLLEKVVKSSREKASFCAREQLY